MKCKYWFDLRGSDEATEAQAAEPVELPLHGSIFHQGPAAHFKVDLMSASQFAGRGSGILFAHEVCFTWLPGFSLIPHVKAHIFHDWNDLKMSSSPGRRSHGSPSTGAGTVRPTQARKRPGSLQRGRSSCRATACTKQKLCLANDPKPKDIQFTINTETAEMCTFEELEVANDLLLCLIND